MKNEPRCPINEENLSSFFSRCVDCEYGKSINCQWVWNAYEIGSFEGQYIQAEEAIDKIKAMEK